MCKFVLLFSALIALLSTERSGGELGTKNTTADLSRYIQEDISDTLILVNEGSPDTLALIRQANGNVEKSIEVSFEDIQAIVLRLSDDSPEDGSGGAAFFPAGSNIIITYMDGTVDDGREIGFELLIEGGFVREGFLAADGAEEIRLTYDFTTPSFISRASAPKEDIEKIELQLVLGNDYLMDLFFVFVEGEAIEPESTVRALGNIMDNSNLAVIRIELTAKGQGTILETISWGQKKAEIPK